MKKYIPNGNKARFKFLATGALFITMFFAGCTHPAKVKTAIVPGDTTAKLPGVSSPPGDGPKWLDSGKVVMAIDSTLSHRHHGFQCDSAIAVSYEGAFNGDSFAPLNKKGQWTNTISKRKRLTDAELQTINSIFGDPQTFKYPITSGCYEPRLGIIYFKGDKVIAQSAICLTCLALQSTAKLGNGKSYSAFNENAETKLKKFYLGLNLD